MNLKNKRCSSSRSRYRISTKKEINSRGKEKAMRRGGSFTRWIWFSLIWLLPVGLIVGHKQPAEAQFTLTQITNSTGVANIRGPNTRGESAAHVFMGTIGVLTEQQKLTASDGVDSGGKSAPGAAHVLDTAGPDIVVSVDLNLTNVVRAGEPLSYNASIGPASLPEPVDIYLGALLPDGVTFFSLVETGPGTVNSVLGPGPVPFRANVQTGMTFTFEYTFTGSEPLGTYFTYAGAVRAGRDPLQQENELAQQENQPTVSIASFALADGVVEIAGKWRGSETATVTCVFEGESETETVEGKGTLVIEQNGRNFSYVPPEMSAPRVGEVEGSTISLSGLFVVPLVGGVNFSKNTFTANGSIINKDSGQEITFNGSGIATGTVEGVGFRCTGVSTGKLKRYYEVAVAVLEGGLLGPVGIDLDQMKVQAANVDSRRVIARGFGAGPFQWSSVRGWLDKINRDLDEPVKVILIGYSLGGDAVRRSSDPNMCTRMTIDPINPKFIDPTALTIIPNQRHMAFPVESPAGKFINILASTAGDLDGVQGKFLLGHYVTGATPEWVEDTPATNHFTVPTRVRQSGRVASEVQACLPSE